MARIPVYQNRVGINAQKVSAPGVSVNTAAGQEAVNMYTAGAEMADKARQLGESIVQRVEQHHQRLKEKQLFEVETQFRQEMQGLLYSQDVDDDDVPAGLLNRKLSQAQGATVAFDTRYEELRQQYLDSLPEEDQRQALLRAMDSHATALRGNVIGHEARQLEADFKNAFEANMQQRVADAAQARDAGAILRAVKDATEMQATGLKRQGLDDASIAVKRGELASQIVASAVVSMAAADPARAVREYERVKDVLPTAARTKIDEYVDGKRVELYAAAAWDQVKGLRLADGMPDESKMLAYVQGLPDTEQDVKDGIWKYVNAKAGELRQQLKALAGAEEKKFMERVEKDMREGRSVADVLKRAKGDERKERVIRRLYDVPVPPDMDRYVELLRQVKAGTPDKDAIYQAFTIDEAITPGQYQQLMSQAIDVELSGVDQRGAIVWRQIEAMAAELPRKQQSEFIAMVSDEVAGKDADEALKIAQEHLKLVPNNWWNTVLSGVDAVAGISARSGRLMSLGAAGVALAGVDVLRTGRNALTSRYGRKMFQEEAVLVQELVRLLGADALAALGSDPGAVYDFAERLGVSVAALEKDTPVNNAIVSLRKHGERVTPGNVKAVLAKYADGNY